MKLWLILYCAKAAGFINDNEGCVCGGGRWLQQYGTAHVRFSWNPSPNNRRPGSSVRCVRLCTTPGRDNVWLQFPLRIQKRNVGLTFIETNKRIDINNRNIVI